MGDLFPELQTYDPKVKANVKYLHTMGCAACPLAPARNPQKNRTPDMPASGSDQPLVYLLGEAPGADEDEEGVQFIGSSGELLRPCIPREFRDRVRFNNVVRSRPPKNRTPEHDEIECCRPSIVKDIEATKPKAIFGFGNVPLEWAIKFTGITLWRGRKVPVKIGSHVCWYYPMLHPSYLLHTGKSGSKDELAFRLDLKRAFAEIKTLPKPVLHKPEDAFNDIVYLREAGNEGLSKLEAMLDGFIDEPDIGIDYETDRLRPYDRSEARILTVAVGVPDRILAFPIDHPDAQWDAEEKIEVRGLWVEFLKQAKGRKYVHNLAFELEWTGVYFKDRSLVRAGKWEDTSTQANILDERHVKRDPGPYSLEWLVQQHFGFNLKDLTSLNTKNLAASPLSVVLRYNGADAKYHCLLGIHQRKLIEQQGLMDPYKLALRRVPCVVLTQMKGVNVDPKEVSRLRKKYEERIEGVGNKLFALPVADQFKKKKHRAFKPLSNPDLKYIAQDLLKWEGCEIYDKRTKTKRFSLDKKVLDTIDHPLARTIVEYREASNRKSTWIDPLDPESSECVLHNDGLIHPVFNTIFAETGRLSCDSPNLQNYPKRDGEGREVRKQIVAPPGCVILAFDYGQIEARCIAMFTKDKRYCDALWEDYDIHMEWAERIARAYPRRIGGKRFLTDKGVMKKFRTDIKNQWTFPLFFGAKLESAAGYLGIPVEFVEPEYNRFWKEFATTKDWQDEQVKFFNKHGYIDCLTGRRRRAPLTLNQICNSPVQGTAAEIVLEGMSRLSEIGDPDLQPEINIHDDLTFTRVPVKRVDEIAERVITEMLAAPFPWINVPITVEMSVGENWMPYDKVLNPHGLQEMEGNSVFRSDTWRK